MKRDVNNMYDNKTDCIINIILDYLRSINFDTNILAFANIEKYPEQIPLGISFVSVGADSTDDTQYVICLFSTFEKNILAIREGFDKLLNQDSPRIPAIEKALSKDDDYLLVFAIMHEIGHIQDHIEKGRDDKKFFNPLFGYCSNYDNNLRFEKYADDYSLSHLDKIYDLWNSLCSHGESELNGDKKSHR